MEKEFVTYDQALALKESGFDEPCFGYYNMKKKFNMGDYTTKHWKSTCLAPLKSQVFRWFREKYNINSHIEYYPSSEDTVAYFFIADEDESINYGTYEEAEEKCIKFLIETVKNM